MKKFIINLIVLTIIVLPLTLITMSGISYAILLSKFEPTNIKEDIQVMNYNVNESYPKEIKIKTLPCDGCMEEKSVLTAYLLKDINTTVHLCDDCLEVFTELEKEEQND